MTGSAIAIPLMGASGASAADGTTWDKVAECESGGAWSADTGNGFYGGLQLTQQDWEKYGGLDYAPSADQASRSQQIAVAEKILADQGPGVWPTCGPASGLSKKSGAANVDTGVGDVTPGSSDSSETSGPSLSNGLGLSNSPQRSDSSSGSSDSSAAESDAAGSPSAAPTEPSSSSSSSDKGEKSAKPDSPSEVGASDSSVPDASPSAVPEWGGSGNSVYVEGTSALVDTGALGTGRHRGDSAVEDPDDGSTAASSGRHASRGNDAHTSAASAYTVRSGDSLESIADSLGLQGGWSALYDANKQAIGADPDHIVAGQALDIPAETVQE